MNENTDLLPDLLHEEFEVQMRGYSRRQVDEFVARRNSEIRDLEQRLSRSLDEAEHLRRELSAVRQHALSGRPAHEEVSERIAQILKLADDEARAQKDKANDDIGKLRSDAQAESERVRSDAREQAERMLTAAQEQAERTISAARSDADKTRTAARAEADRLTNDAQKKADAALANAKSQAKKVLDEATARATAIHDGADRRLNMLTTRHAETVRRLTDILENVSSLVAAENARPSLEDEVEQNVAKTLGPQAAANSATSDVPTPVQSGPPSSLGVRRPATAAPGGAVPAGATPAGASPATSVATPASATAAPVKPDVPGKPGDAAAKRTSPPLAPPNPATRVSSAGAPPPGSPPPGSPPPGSQAPGSQAMGSIGGRPAGQKPATETAETPVLTGDGAAAGVGGPDAARPGPGRREPAHRPSTIDPDETTEGIRLMP